MRAGLRWGVLMAVAGLWLGPAAHAQDAAQATTNTPAADAVGPRELQNFSLPGTVTRPAETPPAQRTAPAAERRPAPRTTTAPAPAPTRAAEAPPANQRAATTTRSAPQPAAQARTASAEVARATPTPAPAPAPTPGFSSVTMRLPPPTDAPADQSQASAGPAVFPEQEEAASALAPEQGLPLWPWLLAAMALGGGGAFLFWRNRGRGAAYAGGPQINAFVAPEPAARPRAPAPVPRPPAPAPAPAPPSSTGGVITTRLRPWVDLEFLPTRCIVEEQEVRFDFDLVLTNSGSAAAKDVLIEAVVINASPEQEQEIAAFFARTDGAGDRIPNIPPLKSVALRPQLALPLNQLRVLEAGGRRVFVPLIAFSAQYRWGSGSAGRTAAVYLLGRETKGEKLAPFSLDLGARTFRGIAGRALPNALRE